MPEKSGGGGLLRPETARDTAFTTADSAGMPLNSLVNCDLAEDNMVHPCPSREGAINRRVRYPRPGLFVNAIGRRVPAASARQARQRQNPQILRPDSLSARSVHGSPTAGQPLAPGKVLHPAARFPESSCERWPGSRSRAAAPSVRARRPTRWRPGLPSGLDGDHRPPRPNIYWGSAVMMPVSSATSRTARRLGSSPAIT